MTREQIHAIVAKQRAWFQTGATLDVEFRLKALDKLGAALRAREAEIAEALRADLGKGTTESFICETGLVLSELGYMRRHLRRYAREKRMPTPLTNFHSRSYVTPSPYGTVLIMSPWNYPLLLALDPLVDAIAAGNTAVVKPSAYSPRTSAVIEALLKECFDEEYVAVVTGGRSENTSLLGEHFDYIFFTGSKAVGHEVMRAAAEHLTPVTLELGGKSPCIVEKTANLKLAARRIVFGKYLNCGQTCVAPDYIYCDRSIKDALIAEIKREIVRQYGEKPLENTAYGRIVSEKHFDRLLGLMDADKLAHGGAHDREALRIEPTVLDGATFEDAAMQQEIFGPILPILTYENLEDAVEKIKSLPHPLALYIFTANKGLAKSVIARCGFGGGCINDVVIHLATSDMGFGGFGESGMGAYHGRTGFDTFSHYKSIVDKKTWLDLPMRYQPYKKLYEKLIRLFLK